ncbi:MAG: hypothetical protein MI974_08785 [Chitinophagales bacterium]|nr:hypothetical protein [Chitinophagales bacterium]
MTEDILLANFRIFTPNDNPLRYRLLQMMNREVLDWGMRSARFTIGSCYSALERFFVRKVLAMINNVLRVF